MRHFVTKQIMLTNSNRGPGHALIAMFEGRQ